MRLGIYLILLFGRDATCQSFNDQAQCVNNYRRWSNCTIPTYKSSFLPQFDRVTMLKETSSQTDTSLTDTSIFGITSAERSNHTIPPVDIQVIVQALDTLSAPCCSSSFGNPKDRRESIASSATLSVVVNVRYIKQLVRYPISLYASVTLI